MVKSQSAWEEARALHPSAPLVRIIDLTQRISFFLALNPTPERRDDASVFDGATVITPNAGPEVRTEAERAAIVAEFDAVWQEAH